MLKKLIFDFKYRFFLRNYLKYYREFQLKENLSTSELKELNWHRRKKIVEFAYAKIPFYTDYYKAHNFSPKQLKSENDWALVPIIDKEILRTKHELIKNPELPKKKLKLSTTGGSTGIPIKVFFDKRVPLEIFGWRVLNWWGLKPWQNQAYVFRNTHRGIHGLLNKIMWWPTRRILLDASSMSTTDIEKFIVSYNRIKPKLLQGYIGGIYEVAKYISNNKVKISPPEAIWVTSAPLTENQRIFMQNTFNAPVYDQYGCSEMFWLAAECKTQKGLHVFSDVRHVEFLDKANKIIQKEELGEVVITDLENYAFPIIRYKNGDKGNRIENECKCGLPFPLIDKIKGRTSDNIYTPEGIVIDGSFLTTIFDDYPNLVNGFQVIQNVDYSIDVNCIPNGVDIIKDKAFDLIKNDLIKKTNNEISVQINFVDDLITDRGKLRYIINKRDEARN